MEANYITRDNFGMYAGDGNGHGDGPGPALMGADTLLGNDVYNSDDEDLGDDRFQEPGRRRANLIDSIQQRPRECCFRPGPQGTGSDHQFRSWGVSDDLA